MTPCTVQKEIDFPRYNMICSGEYVILCEIFHVVSRVPLYFMLYRGNCIDFLTVHGVMQTAESIFRSL